MKKIIIDCDPEKKFEKAIEFYIRLLYNIDSKLI